MLNVAWALLAEGRDEAGMAELTAAVYAPPMLAVAERPADRAAEVARFVQAVGA